MDYQNLLFEKQGRLGILTINRPKAFNALNSATISELSDFCKTVAKDDSIDVIIVTGSGDKAFVAGADVAEMQPMYKAESRAFCTNGQEAFNKIENLRQPVIAAVNGFALGGGCELAMACDIRIASEKAKFGQPEVSLGIVPGFGGTQRLPRLVGMGVAKEMIFTGDWIDAQEAYRIGLVNKVVPAEDLMKAAMEMAEKILSRGQVAVRLAKSAINEGVDGKLQSGMKLEIDAFGNCFDTIDQKEGMSAFAEKRKANFVGK